ncbi:MAG: alpha/beta hydrolase [SAR202 cluster bacterium]|nr:alpha/beta hydrolase [SAR202 cluster bacterium]
MAKAHYPSIHNLLLGAEIKFIQGRKYRTRVIEMGEGEPLVCIHGVGGHAEAYSRNMRQLARHFRVLAIDAVNHGFSQKDTSTNDFMDQYVDQVIDLLDAIGARQACLEGESMGGWIGMHVGLRHPERLKRLVLNTAAGVRFDEDQVHVDHIGGMKALADRSIAAISNPNPETVRKRLEWLMAWPDRVTDELVDLRLQLYSRPDVQHGLKHVFSTHFYGEHAERYQIRESELKNLKVPTLALWSDKNPGTGPAAGERLSRLIPGAQYYCIADAGHWPQWEQPEDHDQAVISFLTSSAPVAAG